ncbi:uncharacterized protein LOC113336457 [Papaver somniferum]|uniref:uncharacterized protein LOC113336457 n=1 Tax=Papaver somniferum TaxID=3469 RepID=UPI000E6FBF98|nr:uncharacterized protein LOC113336457 [Papaver somniferum]XP_026438049.1 uncharacterized protein LOC113336457 [Papaver somniferum]
MEIDAKNIAKKSQRNANISKQNFADELCDMHGLPREILEFDDISEDEQPEKGIAESEAETGNGDDGDEDEESDDDIFIDEPIKPSDKSFSLADPPAKKDDAYVFRDEVASEEQGPKDAEDDLHLNQLLNQN